MECIFAAEQILPPQYVEMMIAYLEEHHLEQIVEILMELDCATSKHYGLPVSASNVITWNGPKGAWLGTMLIHQPMVFVRYFDDAIRVVQKSLLGKHDERHFMAFKASVHTRICRLPYCPELRKQTVSSLRADDVNRMIQVPGTVIRTGQLKMLQLEREYECVKCKYRFSCCAELEQRHQMTLPSECTHAVRLKICGGNKFELIEGSERCHDYQEIRIQEQVHRLMVGSIPRSITVLLQDDLIDSCKAGDDITVVGMLRKWWRPLQRGMRPDAELAIDALHVRVNNEERGAARVSKEAVLEFEDFWSRHASIPLKGRDELVAMACPSLAGMYLVKLAMILTLIGGVSHVDANGMKLRGESHMLLVGDAGTGKSQILRHAAQLSPRSVLTTGIGATAAGLTSTAVRDAGGEWMLEAGALVLADGGICAIDEFDSIREHDRGAIHEAMEQQTLSVAKAGLVCKLRTKCSVFAACNPKAPVYDREHGVPVNTGLPSPLLSRFDIVLLLSDGTMRSDGEDTERDRDVADHILREALGDAPGSSEAQRWAPEKLRAYLEYVKGTFKPSMSPVAQSVLVAYYSNQRQANTHSEGRTTIRLLESTVRLAQAHARLMYQAEVTLRDAIYVVLLMEASTHQAKVIPNLSALHSRFDDDPDATYPFLRDIVLSNLGLDVDGNPLAPSRGGGGGS